MAKLYTDFDLSFELNYNNDLKEITDEDAIRIVIRNSIMMNSYDIPFNSWYAANIKKYLFEQPNKISESEIKKSIMDVLLLDVRLQDPEVSISYSSDNKFCNIDVTVFVVMLNRTINETIKINRIR